MKEQKSVTEATRMTNNMIETRKGIAEIEAEDIEKRYDSLRLTRNDAASQHACYMHCSEGEGYSYFNERCRTLLEQGVSLLDLLDYVSDPMNGEDRISREEFVYEHSKELQELFPDSEPLGKIITDSFVKNEEWLSPFKRENRENIARYLDAGFSRQALVSYIVDYTWEVNAIDFAKAVELLKDGIVDDHTFGRLLGCQWDWEMGGFDLLKVCSFAHEHGASLEEIEDLFDEVKSDEYRWHLFSEMAYKEYSSWVAIGVDVEKYLEISIEGHLSNYFDKYWREDVDLIYAKNLFTCLDVHESLHDQALKYIVEKISLKRIIDSDWSTYDSGEYPANDFLLYFKNKGGDLNALARRFTKEMDYNYDNWFFTAAFMEIDASVLDDGIDVDKYVNFLIDCDEFYDDDEKSECLRKEYDFLKKAGVDETKIARLIA